MENISVAHLPRNNLWGGEHLLGKVALCVYESRIKSASVEEIVATRFPLSETVQTLAKAAQNPAMTSVPGYAQELTRTAYGELQDGLRSASVLAASVPAEQLLQFDSSNGIYVPTRTGTPVDAAGGFRGEAMPVVVRGLAFSHVLLVPKSCAAILTATMEMLHRSTVDLSRYFQNAITQDTARAIDQRFVSNLPATAIAPAGVRNGLAAGDTRASSGGTAAQITSDLKLMLSALAAAEMGSPATRWLMHPKNWFALSLLPSATGALQFPEAALGRIAGIPVVQSLAMPTDIVLLIDFEQFVVGMGNAEVMPTEFATLHEENAAPLPLANAGTLVVAQPQRSLYQTFSWALRAVLSVDWAKLKPNGPVQELTAVGW